MDQNGLVSNYYCLSVIHLKDIPNATFKKKKKFSIAPSDISMLSKLPSKIEILHHFPHHHPMKPASVLTQIFALISERCVHVSPPGTCHMFMYTNLTYVQTHVRVCPKEGFSGTDSLPNNLRCPNQGPPRSVNPQLPHPWLELSFQGQGEMRNLHLCALWMGVVNRQLSLPLSASPA